MVAVDPAGQFPLRIPSKPSTAIKSSTKVAPSSGLKEIFPGGKVDPKSNHSTLKSVKFEEASNRIFEKHLNGKISPWYKYWQTYLGNNSRN